MATAVANAGTVVNDTSIGAVAWTNASNAAGAANGTEASANVGTSTSQYLKGTNFGFAIPGGSTINGISMRFLRRNSGVDDLDDSNIRLVKSGVISGDDKAFTSWDNLLLAYSPTYGGASDLWGLTFTPAEINDSGFGVAISCTHDTGTDNVGQVDAIEITVHYTPGAVSGGGGWFHQNQIRKRRG